MSSWWNPLSYIQTDLPSTSTSTVTPLQHQHSHTSLSTTSTSTHTQQLQWYNPLSWWTAPTPKTPIDEDSADIHGETVTSTAILKVLRDAKRQLLKDEPIWAWYQPCSIDNTITTTTIKPEHHTTDHTGELSILGSRSETSPIHLPKFPISDTNHHKFNNECVNTIPTFHDNFRLITLKTKVRIAFELYYNYPTESHLYLKPSSSSQSQTLQGHNKKALIISISNGIPANTSQRISNSLKQALYTENLHIDTISLELGKSPISKDTTEDIFKLLINWRESFLDTQILLITGLKDTVSIAVELLDVLITRKSFPKLTQSGLILMEGSSSKQIDITILDHLVYNHGTKLSIMGSLQTTPSSLALNITHPNIHRFLSIPVINNNHDMFKLQLFKMLLVCVNLGKKPHNENFELARRLILQMLRYFQDTLTSTSSNPTTTTTTSTTTQTTPNKASQTPLSFIDLISPESLKPIVTHQLHSTSLFKKKHVKYEPALIDDLLENKYNLIWNFHAFLDGFKKLPNIDTRKEIDLLLRYFRNWDDLINGLTTIVASDTIDMNTPLKDHSNNSTTSNTNNNQALNTNTDLGISPREKELSQMLEVLKIEDYCACLLGS